MLSSQLQSRHRPVAQTLFLVHILSSSSSFARLRSMIYEKKIFPFVCRTW